MYDQYFNYLELRGLPPFTPNEMKQDYNDVPVSIFKIFDVDFVMLQISLMYV